jgi:hypothetical protein
MHALLAVVVGAAIVIAALVASYIVGRIVFFFMEGGPGDVVLTTLAGVMALCMFGLIIVMCGLIGGSIIGN